MRVLPSSRGERIRLGALVGVLLAALAYAFIWIVLVKVRYQPIEGDLLFQSLPNPRGLDVVDAIEGATDCPFSHCGVVVNKNGEWFVLEAMVPTVQEIPLSQWTNRDRGRVAVYRLKEQYRSRIPSWIAEMRKRMGLRYDYRYRMEDDEIYCSELPYDGWKNLTGEEMGQVVTLGELAWKPYREVILDIEGSEEVPVEREMITPRDLAKAPQIELVMEIGVSVDG